MFCISAFLQICDDFDGKALEKQAVLYGGFE